MPLADGRPGDLAHDVVGGGDQRCRDGGPDPSHSPGTPSISLVASNTDEGPPVHVGTPSGAPLHQAWDKLYHDAQWTADGTSIVTSSWANRIETYVLPSDLLSADSECRHLEPYSQIPLPAQTSITATSPLFSLSDPSTQTVLVGCRGHPIQLYQLFPHAKHTLPVASYRLIKHETEEFLRPLSVLWQYPGHHFLCGSARRLDYFDMSREGEHGLILTISAVTSKRSKVKRGIGTVSGAISCLSSSSPDSSGSHMIAAGTWGRWIGLYDITRSSAAVATWSVNGASSRDLGVDIEGTGIVQTIWSPCGRYLLVNERAASGILVYDIRGTGRPLCALTGRAPNSQQSLKFDLYPSTSLRDDASAFEVWAGTADGTVLVWDDPIGKCVDDTNAITHTWAWQSHDAPVSSAMLHPSGSVVATCGGAWFPTTDDRILPPGRSGGDGHFATPLTEVSSDVGIKLWSLGTHQESDAEE